MPQYNDTYVVDFGNGELDGSDVQGGDGTDLVSTTALTGGTAMNVEVDLTSSNAGVLDALTNVEQFQADVTGSMGNETVAVDDATSSAFGGSFNVVVKDGDMANNATAEVDASGTVLNSSSVTVSTDLADMSGTTVTYKGGNAVEDVTLSANGDTVEYDTTSFLSGNDTIDGGDDGGGMTGINVGDSEDTLSLTEDLSMGGDETVTADLSGVSNVEQLDIALAGSGSNDVVEATLTDSQVAANTDSNDEFEVSGTNLTGMGSIDIDGSGVSDASSLLLQGSSQADTLIGGAGADTIDGGTGGDTLTGNGGDDTFVVDGTNTGDITDFDFGDDRSASNPQNADALDVSGPTLAGTDGVQVQDGNADMQNVIVLDDNTFDQAGVDSALASEFGGSGQAFAIWQDGLGNIKFGLDATAQTASGASDITQLGTLDNEAGDLSITGIADAVDNGDFVF